MENSTILEVVPNADTITDNVRNVVQVINFVIICGIISLFGIGFNIVNISVFVTQGFKDSINISLLGLAVSDLACSITMFWNSIYHNPMFQNVDLPIVHLDVMYLTSGLPHFCTTRITSFITGFITLERCLCIAMPLKVKNIITPFRTKVIICSIYASIIILLIPFYFVNILEWKHNPSNNRSILQLTFTPDREIVDSILLSIHSVFLSSALLLSVIICTIILVVKLNKKTKWREASTAQTNKLEETSAKEKKVVKMITSISAMFIVCYFPATVGVMVMVFIPDFNMGGKYENLFFVTWSVLLILDNFNSSMNFCVYYKMSSKYRQTLSEIYCRHSVSKSF